MVEALLIVCFLLALIGVISKEYVGRRLEDRQRQLNDALREAQRTAGERHQNEDLLVFEEDKERRLQAEYQILAGELASIKSRLSGSSPG